MEKTYRTSVEVRGYELDSYGHLNNAIYISYLEHARWKMLEQEGITLARLNEWKRWPVIASIEAKYLKPTYIGEQLDIDTQIVEHRRVGFTIEQKISRRGEVVFSARIGAVIVNEKGRPDTIPEEITRLWRKE